VANKIKIIIDHREKRSRVVQELYKPGVDIEVTTLEVGDYIVSDRVAFERKTVDDLFMTLIERRELFSQLRDLSNSYRRPILIIEGEDPFFYSSRRMNPAAILGLLNSIALMRIPTLYTLNEAETAQVICMIAEKEQSDKSMRFNFHGKRNRLSQSETKEYVVSSIPGIGTVVAGNLLRYFGCVENVLTAPVHELMKVDRVGRRIANRIRKLAGERY
jgi:ERCC4-type nuclease